MTTRTVESTSMKILTLLALALCSVTSLAPAVTCRAALLNSCRQAVPCRAVPYVAMVEGDDADDADNQLMSELRKALSSLDDNELAASDERVLVRLAKSDPVPCANTPTL